jgi:hypothetical protein
MSNCSVTTILKIKTSVLGQGYLYSVPTFQKISGWFPGGSVFFQVFFVPGIGCLVSLSHFCGPLADGLAVGGRKKGGGEKKSWPAVLEVQKRVATLRPGLWEGEAGEERSWLAVLGIEEGAAALRPGLGGSFFCGGFPGAPAAKAAGQVP